MRGIPQRTFEKEGHQASMIKTRPGGYEGRKDFVECMICPKRRQCSGSDCFYGYYPEMEPSRE